MNYMLYVNHAVIQNNHFHFNLFVISNSKNSSSENDSPTDVF